MALNTRDVAEGNGYSGELVQSYCFALKNGRISIKSPFPKKSKDTEG